MAPPASACIFACTCSGDIGSFAIDPSDAEVTVWREASYQPCDIAVFYGAVRPATDGTEANQLRRTIDAQHRGPQIVIETGFVGRSFERRRFSRIKSALGLPQRAGTLSPYSRIGIGGAFGDDADFCNRDSPADRWERLKAEFSLSIAPWRSQGRHILLIGQVPQDASLRGLDMGAWLIEAIGEIRKHSNRPIWVRLHPVTRSSEQARIRRAIGRQSGICFCDPIRPIWKDLEDAWACITYSSSTSVEALLAGVPAICVSPANIAYGISSNTIAEIESPLLPEREQWFHDLAYAQWTPAEWASGAVWQHLRSAVAAKLAHRAG